MSLISHRHPLAASASRARATTGSGSATTMRARSGALSAARANETKNEIKYTTKHRAHALGSTRTLSAARARSWQHMRDCARVSATRALWLKFWRVITSLSPSAGLFRRLAGLF